MQLGNLRNLERLTLDVKVVPGFVDLTGEQLACLVTDLPNLRDLRVGLGEIELFCSPLVMTTLAETFVKIEHFDIPGMTFTEQV
jgi:hypothetical protein